MRGSAYRPPPLRIQAGLGQAPSLGNPGFAGSLLFIAGGVGGFLMSDVFGSPISGLLKGLGIGAAGWGIFNIVSSFTSPSSSADSKSKAATTKAMSRAAFDAVQGSIIFPISGSRPELQSQFLAPDYFNVKVFWRNGPAEAANFPYDIVAYSVSGPGIAVDGKPVDGKMVTTRVAKIIWNSNASIAPGDQSTSDDIKIELFKPPDKGTFSDLAGQPAPYFKIYLQLRKIWVNEPIPVGDLMEYGPFDYSKY